MIDDDRFFALCRFAHTRRSGWRSPHMGGGDGRYPRPLKGLNADALAFGLVMVWLIVWLIAIAFGITIDLMAR